MVLRSLRCAVELCIQPFDFQVSAARGEKPPGLVGVVACGRAPGRFKPRQFTMSEGVIEGQVEAAGPGQTFCKITPSLGVLSAQPRIDATP